MESCIKVLHVVPQLGRNRGGPSDSVPMTAIAQRHAGLEVAIAFCDTPLISFKAEEAEREGVRLIRFSWKDSLLNPEAFSLDFMRRFESFAKEYDIIHTHMQWQFPMWWAAYVANKLGKCLIMMPRGSFEPVRLKISAWKKRLVGCLDRWAVRHSDAVWATAESEVEGIRTYSPGAHVEVFPIGLPVECYSQSNHCGKTILYFSRISFVKGLDLLAEAWGRCGNTGWKLLIVGPDDRGYTQKMKKVFEEKCIPGSYEFRDPVYGDDKFRLLSSVEAFVLPTRSENWGIVVGEAMASGLPVICTKGAPWSCIESAHAGWWVDVDASAIEDALRKLMSLTRDERIAMGQNGRRWVAENLSWEKIGSNMRASYEALLKRKEEGRAIDD